MEKGGILREGWGRCGQKSRAGLCRVVRWQERALCGQGPVPAAVWPETDSLADPWPCLATDTLSPAYAMQDKDSMFQVGITALKFKVANPRALGAPSTRPSHCWSMGGQDPLDHRLRGSLRRGGGRIGTGPSLQ